jgi:hypothetical protein
MTVNFYSISMIKRIFLLILILAGTLTRLNAQDNARYVNVFIGTDGTGHTLPGPSMPFGLVQPGFRFLTDSLVLESEVKIEDDQTISGYCHTIVFKHSQNRAEIYPPHHFPSSRPECWYGIQLKLFANPVYPGE